jgi:hypothetical protein
MRERPLLLLLLLSALAPPVAVHADSTTCASLKQLSLPNATIDVAQDVAAGAFVPPGLKPDQKPGEVFKSAPAFCRVTATLKPTPDSDIKVEVWMPASGWNGKFRGVGNGGFAGSVNYGGLAGSVTRGYASVSTDTGHATTDASWALGHPEKIIDYGYRAIHEMTVDAKTVVQKFYGKAPARAYFASCSNGGRQALMEAQRFPDDYDGVVAGAPANTWVPMLTGGLNLIQTLHGAGFIPPTKIPAISKAVLAACDELDGVKDGVLGDPRKCHFDPAILLCKGKESDACLTQPQVDSMKMLYSGAHDAAGKQIFPGALPGAEDGDGGWKDWITGSEEGKSAAVFFVTGYFSNMVYGQKDWDYTTVNINDAMKLAYAKTGEALDAMNPDLKPFLAHGKLILYHGWDDPGIAALNTVNYYESVVSTVGPATAQSLRLYMVPGMQHCGGGPGATFFGQNEAGPGADASHDIFTSLVEWVEDGKTPGSIIATKPAGQDPVKSPKMTRPICPYPQAAKYRGAGNSNAAESFECTAPN